MFTDDQIAVIDKIVADQLQQFVQAGAPGLSATGAVQSIQSDNDCTVVFDGSSASVQVKNFGNVFLLAGDRVGLRKCGTWWVVDGVYNRRWMQVASRSVQQTLGTTTSSTLVDLPNTCSLTFTKNFDATHVLVFLASAARIETNTNTQITFGVQFSGATGTTLLSDVCSPFFNPTAQHASASDMALFTGSSLPADTYTVTAKWRRNFGSGTLTIDTNDRTALTVMEVTP